jgi:hypothetical protein
MNREDIIRMARQAGLATHVVVPNTVVDIFEKFANLVAAHERQWEGLTYEEIKSLPSWWPSYEDAPALLELVKDVEAKLKEKNT